MDASSSLASAPQRLHGLSRVERALSLRTRTGALLVPAYAAAGPAHDGGEDNGGLNAEAVVVLNGEVPHLAVKLGERGRQRCTVRCRGHEGGRCPLKSRTAGHSPLRRFFQVIL
jgi:hypothetical protein